MNLELLKSTLKLNAFSLFKIPLILFCTPRVLRMDTSLCEIKIPLNYRTKNHLNSMYFGALAIGADCAAGMIAMFAIQESKKNISLVFKEVKGNFLKRATEDVIFRCEAIERVRKLVQEALQSSDRVECMVPIQALGAKSGELFAEFELCLSLKNRS